MKVYVIVLAQMDDFYWYILNKTNWDKLDQCREFCEQIHDVECLASPIYMQEVFDLIRINGWIVTDSVGGVYY